jgi:FkbM family methyltransferase
MNAPPLEPLMTPTEITGWRRFIHLKLRFGLSKLPLFPVRYRLRTSGCSDAYFRWTCVMPFMDPVRGAFDFELYGWDVRELRFLRRFLQPGMNFADIGAHHGLYTLLAAQQVGASGRVVAFEPAPPIVRRLRWHVSLNRIRSVEVVASAVGATTGSVPLFAPARGVDTIASLKPPELAKGEIKTFQVPLSTLDVAITQRRLERLDLVKLDVEGAETDVLEGAAHVLKALQPLWLFEALDATSHAWGGSGRALVARFIELDHEIFEFTPQGWLRAHRPRDAYPLDSNCNLLAVPRSRRALITPLLASQDE